MTFYRNILKQAWLVTWRYKVLWIFGFLASFWGIGSAYEIVYKSVRLQDQQSFFLVDLWRDLANQGITLDDLLRGLVSSPASLLFLFLFVILSVLIFLCFYWLFTCGQIALIKGVNAIETKPQDFHNLFEASKKHFWPAFGVNLLGKIITFILLLVLSYPVLSPLLGTEFSTLNFLLFLLIFIIIFVLVLLISIVVVYSSIYIALKGNDLRSAVQKGWQLLNKNWLVSIETAFLLFLISVAVGLAFILALIISLVPFVVLFKLSLLISSGLAFWLLILLALLLILIVYILSAGILSTFQLSLWVSLFEKLEKGQATSKLERLAGSILSK